MPFSLTAKLRSAAAIASSLYHHSKNLRISSRHTPSIEALLALHHYPTQGTLALDLGCGTSPRNIFGASEIHGVDIVDHSNPLIRAADLAREPIPFADNSFDFCTAFDLIEHIPRTGAMDGKSTLPFVALMNEIHRILRPGGLFLHSTPAYPSKQAFQDPTHVNFITEDTFPIYFCRPNLWASKAGYSYGFTGCFELLDQAWLYHVSVVSLLRAEKSHG
jgi:SAM-dependent methyltransferase